MTNYLLPDYEKQCLTEYLSAGEDRLIFANTGDQQLNVLTSTIVKLKKLIKLKMYIEKHSF